MLQAVWLRTATLAPGNKHLQLLTLDSRASAFVQPLLQCKAAAGNSGGPSIAWFSACSNPADAATQPHPLQCAVPPGRLWKHHAVWHAQEKKKKELEELEAVLAEFDIEGAPSGGGKPSTAVRLR